MKITVPGTGDTGVFLGIWKIFDNIFFTEHIWATASVEKQLRKYSRK